MVSHNFHRRLSSIMMLPALLLVLVSQPLLADDVWQKIEAHKRMRQFHEAALLLEPQCRQNDARACLELAQFYRNGLGVPRDVTRAAALLKNSANAGNSDAQYQLGVMLANGSAGQKNIAQARHYLTQAAGSGNRKAAMYLSELSADVKLSADDKLPAPAALPATATRKREPKVLPPATNDAASSTAQLQAAAKASGISALTLSIERGNLALTRQALAAEPDPWEIDTQGHTPITRAALYAKPEVLQYLLTESSGKGLVGTNGRSALFYAVDGNSGESVRLLTAAGIKTTTVDAKGVSPVEYALQNRSAQADTLLALTPTSQWLPRWLPLAAEHGNRAFCLKMINAGIAVDALDAQSRTALWYAVSSNDDAMAQALLAKGADPLVKDKAGNTLLHVAARNPASKNIAALVTRFKAGGQISVKNHDGDSALHLACAAGAATTVDLLLASGADKDQRGNAGNTPLMQAVSAHNIKAVNSLIAAAANLTLRNDNKKDALGMAQQLGYRDIETSLQQALKKQGVMSIFH